VKLRILFVDDEPKVLQGLQRMLRPMQHEWEMAFSESGKEALEILEKEPFDVVVSDMRMPGMDGAQLLNEVKKRYPQTMRLVLSGHSDREMILKSVGATHQYLIKPSDPESLKAVLKRAFALRELLNDEVLKRLISRLKSLPSIPSLYMEVMQELQSPDSSMQKVGKIISQDMGMAAKILQLVNSAFFGLPRQISSPEQAVGLLGLDTIRALVLSIHVFSQFDEAKLPGFHLTALWDHCVAVGSCANRIAKSEKTEKKSIDDALTAGLLHDCGKLVLATNLPDLYQEVLYMVDKQETNLLEAEKETFGTTHAEVGAYLLGLWGLPDPIVEAVAFHHHPTMCIGQTFSSLTAVHLANALDHELRSTAEPATRSQIDLDYLNSLGVVDRLPAWRKACKAQPSDGDN